MFRRMRRFILNYLGKTFIFGNWLALICAISYLKLFSHFKHYKHCRNYRICIYDTKEGEFNVDSEAECQLFEPKRPQPTRRTS